MRPKDKEALEAANIIKSYCHSYANCSHGCVLHKGILGCSLNVRCCPEEWMLPDIKKEEEAHE
ncbi:MAG: hypothetical protein IKY89_05710 [Alistipes sp.]|nr:hypothetical protein [Alistipes sp.]